MAGGKSSGLDGFPAEFYRRFWSLLGPDDVEVMNFCYATGQLSASQRSGVITLLYKRGDRLDMKNWRPITSLCVDYKLSAKAIANRLLQVLPYVIILTSHAVYRAAILFTTYGCCMISSLILTLVVWVAPSSHSIRRRPSTGWSGRICTAF